MNPPYKSGLRRQRGGTGTRILVIFFLVGVVALFLLARGCYKAVESVRNSFSSSHKSSASKASDPNRFAFPVEKCPDFPPDKAAEQRAGQAAAKVPLVRGLILDGILSIQKNDVEGLSQFASDDDNTITFSYSGSGFHREKGNVVVDKSFHTDPYTFCRSEIPSSRVYVGRMYDKHPAVFTSGTYHQISLDAFRQLKESGSTQITIHTHAFMRDKQPAFEGDLGLLLRRTDHGDANYRVIVNDQLTDLPVITADGTPSSGSGTLHFAALDDPAFPLVLVWEWAGESDSSKTVKITYPVQKIEKDLQERGRAEIYGIYFDFDSDQIRSESEPVLTEIADVLKKQPEWKLNVEGHTDNVGGDKHNLDLSQRRAASVINALVTRYQIAADRLSPTGYGASRPKATNDTVEGRALNRRVELVRK
jgi:outer membrane protein OmpA-like peptidoglycan-associated protein